MTKEHVFFVNAHPDDLVACMGLCRRLSADPRFEVHVVDVTRGERGLAGKGIPMAECAAIREKEEEAVCGAMGLKPVWLHEVDGEACASREACNELARLFAATPPRAIITQWPVDRHMDHVMAGAIALNAMRFAAGVIGGQVLKAATEVYFYAYASNSIGFMPTHYLPLTPEEMDQVAALIARYECQDGATYIAPQARMEAECHGLKARVPYAEAYEAFQLHTPGQPCLFDLLAK